MLQQLLLLHDETPYYLIQKDVLLAKHYETLSSKQIFPQLTTLRQNKDPAALYARPISARAEAGRPAILQRHWCSRVPRSYWFLRRSGTLPHFHILSEIPELNGQTRLICIFERQTRRQYKREIKRKNCAFTVQPHSEQVLPILPDFATMKVGSANLKSTSTPNLDYYLLSALKSPAPECLSDRSILQWNHKKIL